MRREYLKKLDVLQINYLISVPLNRHLEGRVTGSFIYTFKNISQKYFPIPV